MDDLNLNDIKLEIKNSKHTMIGISKQMGISRVHLWRLLNAKNEITLSKYIKLLSILKDKC